MTSETPGAQARRARIVAAEHLHPQSDGHQLSERDQRDGENHHRDEHFDEREPALRISRFNRSQS